MKQWACPCCGVDRASLRLKALVPKLEAMLGRELFVTSAYRCPKHNARVGGAKASEHLKGRAIDAMVRSVEEREKLISYAKDLGFTGIGRYPNRVHLDLGKPREWTVE